MRILIKVLFLVSFGPVSMAGVGNVYYCEMTNYVEIYNHEIKQYKLDKFMFIWEIENKIKLNLEDTYYTNFTFDLDHSLPLLESFRGTKPDAIIRFHEGDFHFSFVGLDAIRAISATCEKV